MKCENCGAENNERNKYCEYCGSLINKNGIPSREYREQLSGNPAFIYEGDASFYHVIPETTTLLCKAVNKLFVGDVVTFQNRDYEIVGLQMLNKENLLYVEEGAMCGITLNGMIKEKDLQKAIRKCPREVREHRYMSFTFK